ncbi:MAG: 2-hydroxyacyl-CoA dehydratase subunit D [Candidatus Helarchaeota archaeon]
MNLDELEYIKISKTLHNSYIDQWKKENKKIYGYYCSYIPEEILHSMDILPYRIRGTEANDTALADSILSHFNCSFIRCTLNLVMEGKYDFLDGMIFSNSCDHTRRQYDIWKRKLKKGTDFPLIFLSIPHKITEAGQVWLREEYSLLIKEIEKDLGKSLDMDKLKASIQIYNENKRLLKELHSLRTLDEPKLSGSDFCKILNTNFSIPKEKSNTELAKIIDQLKGQEGLKDYRARFMLVGSYIDNPDFYKIFEEVGGLIVSDALCFGLRYFWDDTKISEDPINDILNRYYYKISCPRMMDQHQQRLNFIKEQIKEAKIDGVILERMEFCDLWGVDNMLLLHELEDDGIPVLSLDREYLMSDIARFKTRAEAFIEQILVG